MVKKCSFFTALVALLLISASLIAQEKRGRISAIARGGEQEITLRWAPHDPLTWKLGNRYGYTVERFTIGKDGVVDSTGQWPRIQMTPQPMKPWPLDDWESIVDGNDYAAIAAQALYGESFEVSDISSDAVAIINQAKEERNRFGFALFAADHSMEVAQASGLRFRDTAVRKGEEYLYRIALASNPSSLPVDTALVTASALPPLPLPSPPEVEAQFGDRIASIRWNGFYFDHLYVSYQVERSADGTSFEPVHDLPIVNGDRPEAQSQYQLLLDSLPQNGKTYYYRVRGITPFSEVGPPSEVVSGQGVVSLVGIYPTIDTILLVNNTQAQVRWSFPDSMQQHVQGYRVLRSSSLNGQYLPLSPDWLSSEINEFSDTAPLSTNYYRVQAVGQDQQPTASVPYSVMLEDSIAPLLPIHFDGKVEESGAVRLQWSPSSSTDVLGYRLFRANDPSEEFVMVSSKTVLDTVFVDSIEVATLTEKVFYRIVAVDRRFNVSNFSDVLELKRPDVVPPVPAQLTSLRATLAGIQLAWLASPSVDVQEYWLLRLGPTSSGYQTIERFMAEDRAYTYLDSLVEPGQEYRYILRTLDDDSLQAAHPALSVTTLKPPPQISIQNLKATADRVNRRIILRWEATVAEKEIGGYRIFRAVDDGSLRHYRFSSQESAFTDQQLAINHRYRYAVQAILKSDQETLISTEVEVVY
jgi:hypothetical protein